MCESGRCFETRRKQHSRNVKACASGASIAKHVWNFNRVALTLITRLWLIWRPYSYTKNISIMAHVCDQSWGQNNFEPLPNQCSILFKKIVIIMTLFLLLHCSFYDFVSPCFFDFRFVFIPLIPLLSIGGCSSDSRKLDLTYIFSQRTFYWCWIMSSWLDRFQFNHNWMTPPLVSFFKAIWKKRKRREHGCLPVPVSARYIRFRPVTQHDWNCLRVEVYATGRERRESLSLFISFS